MLGAVLAAAGILAYQLFAPGFVGLADNGDFPRIAGRFSLCPAEGWDRDRFRFFVSAYEQRAPCFWNAQVPTSALVPVALARTFAPAESFPIRALAGVYSAAFLGFVALWPALLIFVDLANTAYFNSFYLDGTSLLALLGVAAAARRRSVPLIAYTIAALFLVTSKMQHAVLALPLALFLFHQVKWRAVLPSLLLLAAAIFMAAQTPAHYRASNLWNSVFISLVPYSPTALADLHISPDFTPFIGRNAYQFPDSATADLWTFRLQRETGYGALVRYYLVHPGLAVDRLLRSGAGLQHVRPDYLGNTQAASGTPPITQSHRVSFWSDAKSRFFRNAPWLASALYAGCGVILFRSRFRALAALLLAMAVLEFTTSTFADSVLDYRHHALLGQLLDLWLLLAAGLIPWHRMMVQFMRRSLAALLLALTIAIPLAAATADPRTLEQLFTRPFSWGTAPSDVTWSKEGHKLAFLWNAKGDSFLDLYAYDPDTRKLTQLTDLSQFRDPLNSSELEKDERLRRNKLPDTGLNSFDLSRDGTRAAFTHLGDLYLVLTDGSAAPFRLTRTKLPESGPQFSPDGTVLSYLRGGQLFAQNLSNGQLTQIVDADNVATYKWSPDGKRVLYVTRGAVPGRQLLLPIYSGRLVTARPFPRNLAGDEPGQSKLFTAASDGTGTPQPMNNGPMGLRVWAQAPPQWSPDGQYLAQTITSADLKREQVLLLNAKTGKAKVLHEIRDAAWANGMSLGWSPDSKAVWFTDDADGFQHLYTVPVAGGKAVQATHGKWEIHREQTLYGQDPQWVGGWLYYSSTEAGPSERQFYRVKPDGSGKERLSEGEGIRIGVVSADGLHRAVLSADLHHPLELTVDGAAITSRTGPAFTQYPWPATQFYSFPSREDHQAVAGKMLLPPGYKAGDKHKWPAVFFIHGSGYATSVLKQWGSYQEYRYVFNSWLANHGYVVFDIDYRGSSGYGRDWRTGIYLDMGGPDLQDVLGVVDYAKSLGNIDMKRCGIWGVSYGGFMTDMALFQAPGTFQAGVAFASVTDWENYNAFYTQQRLNKPQDNPEAYRRSSPITYAGELQDPLLIVHGMADSNVLFQDDVQLTEKLVQLGNPHFSEIFYPEENHGFAREESLTDSFRRTAEFFDTHLRAHAK